MVPLGINWPLSSTTGYGTYGLQILMQYLRRGGQEFILTDHLIPPIRLPPPFDQDLMPRLQDATAAARFLDAQPGEYLRLPHPVLHGIGNSFCLMKNQLRVTGRPNIACVALEETFCPPEWKPFLQIYDRFISISKWNSDFLNSLNIAPVDLCYQGIDTNLFYYDPRITRDPNKFVIFSGGKFEFRKGQDIVVAAFKQFRATHPDAHLITTWQSRHPSNADDFAAVGYCHTVPRFDAAIGALDIASWLYAQGLPPDSFTALPWLTNADMPTILRGCDASIFPNRCEGGTNLVAMEALACGVPTYVSYNTGHKDLVDLTGCLAFQNQSPLKKGHDNPALRDWGESDVDEVIASLERAYARHADDLAHARFIAEKMKAWDWAVQNDKLLDIIFNA